MARCLSGLTQRCQRLPRAVRGRPRPLVARSSTSRGGAEASSKDPTAPCSVEHVGYFRSCFSCRNGCPRQGSLAPNSVGVVELRQGHEVFEAPAGLSLTGLEGFSHAWLLWHFSEYQSRKMRSPRVRPPRLGGESLGVFACRSPKRPSRIGMTACRIEGVSEEGAWLRVSGVDLLDGTPILDIKPYVPRYDSFPGATVPAWMDRPSEALGHRSGVAAADVEVRFEPRALEELESVSRRSGLFRDSAAMEGTIAEVLSQDPRSRTSKKHDKQEYGFRLDNARVTCVFRRVSGDGLEALVTRVEAAE
ncbi:tRNA-methyltransferase O [Chloropicon roscoffensis]|uniref:tRNA-methyltransferase O n=1 Tax=Chloropicon roscoffensis TaxID=1461544 RepID=A0AAX4NZH4_9CHLO